MRFYVYILARPDGRPFYVGKGCDDRIEQHEREARRGCRCHKCNVIHKLWREGQAVERYVMLWTDDELEALAYETYQIALWRAMNGADSLTNRTDGGQGLSGYRHRPETRASIQRALQGRGPSSQTLEAARAWHIERPTPDEVRTKISAALKGQRRTPDAIQNARDARARGAGWVVTTDMRQAVAAANKRRVWTPEMRAAMSEKMKGRPKPRKKVIA